MTRARDSIRNYSNGGGTLATALFMLLLLLPMSDKDSARTMPDFY
jgi:hypothetical protein